MLLIKCIFFVDTIKSRFYQLNGFSLSLSPPSYLPIKSNKSKVGPFSAFEMSLTHRAEKMKNGNQKKRNEKMVIKDGNPFEGFELI